MADEVFLTSLLENQTSPAHDVVFFLGAGASVHAGVPPMLEMTRLFGKFLKNDADLARFYETLTGKIKSQKDVAPNIEEILGLLYQLIDLSSDKPPPLATCVTLAKELDNKSLRRLRQKLEAFIREQTLKPDKTKVADYLAPLLSPNWPRPVEIFSVNYDICMELLCDALKWKLVDGFEPAWNPDILRVEKDSSKQQDTMLLHKLHGSVLWYRTQDGSLVKNHIRPDPNDPEVYLYDGRKAEQLLLYPAFKHPTEPPFLDLAQRLRERLSQVKSVVVIGYAFADEHLRHIFWDAFIQNPEARMILIDPNARNIYDRMFGEPAFKTVFENRVSCCPFKAESFLKDFTHQEFSQLTRTANEFNSRLLLEQTTGECAWVDFLKPGNLDQYIDLDLSRRIYKKAHSKALDDVMSLRVQPRFMYEFLYPAAKNLALAVACGDEDGLKSARADYDEVTAAMWRKIVESLSFNAMDSKITCPDIGLENGFLDPTDRFLNKLVAWSGQNGNLVELNKKFKLMKFFLKELRDGMTIKRFSEAMKVQIPDLTKQLLRDAGETDEQFWKRIQKILGGKTPAVFSVHGRI